VMSFTQTFPRLLSYSVNFRAQSGLPYTPNVLGDINGDGYSNDRAFIFDPATAGDTAVSNAMSKLLSGAPSGARACLRQQLGAVAARNSCTGPWSAPLMTMTFSPDAYRVGLGNRGFVTLLLTNVLGGVDQLVHGSNNLHGWGQQAFPDANLLTVRGFDPATNRFRYTVNPLFGSSSVFRNTFRSPFIVTLDVRMEVGPDRETQYVNLAMRPRAGEKGDSLTLEQIKSRVAGQPFNPIDRIVQQKDSLKLTPAQVDTLSKMSHVYAVTRDSMMTDLARFLLARHGNYGGEAVRERWHSTGLAAYIAARNMAAASKPLFTPEQMDKLTKNPGLGNFVVQDYNPELLKILLRTPLQQLP
jgi:hypothetical protein